MFRDYYTTSAVLRSRLDWWLEEPEMWVLHFRSVVSFGNTNNGVEALNRVLKENVLQHRKNNAVSFLLTVSFHDSVRNNVTPLVMCVPLFPASPA